MKYHFLLFVLISYTAFGQDNPQEPVIIGSIVDNQKNPVPYGNVAVHNPADSALITGGVSDAEGKFHVPVKPGKYYVKISFLSYQDKIIPDVAVSNATFNLGVVTLNESSQVLEEVIVQGEKASMELQLDKRVFNIQKDLSNVGRNASDILGNLPSVTVDVDGTVSLRGSDNVRILIDGKPSGLTSRDPEALRMLQGNLIESIEVITNPSSRYDAAGEVGIINIILKKNQEKGVNGSFSANVGYPAQYGGSYSINIRRKKVNLFSSYGIEYDKRPGYGNSFQQYTSADTSFSYTQRNDRTQSEFSHNFTVGADYFLNDNTTLTASILYNTGDGLSKAETVYEDFDEAGLIARTVRRNEREKEDEENIETSLSLKKNFERKGQIFTADFKWIKSVDDESTDYNESVNDGLDSLQNSINFADEINWLFQADYIHPFGKQGKLEAGVKTATRIINNDYGLDALDNSMEWINIPQYTNELVYTERIHAAYMMGSNTFGRLSMQGGLRAELTDISTELKEPFTSIPQNYFNLFPSASLSYKVQENKTLQLSYSYRINRPDFRNLLPFSDFRDPRVLFGGNPNLRPVFTNSIETGYLLDWDYGSILSNVYYRHRKNVIQRIITEPDSAGRSRVMPINLADENSYGVEFNLSLNIQDWWRVNTSANFYRSIMKGVYEGEVLESDTYTWTTRTTSKMTLFEKWDFQASFNYRAPRLTTQGKDLSIYSIDLGLSRDVLKGKGTITANVRDLMNSRKRRAIIDRDGYYSNSEFQWRSRQFTVTFTYRLNKAKERQRNNQEERGEEEE
ncbi:TonB-dependent receptor [Chryseolinea sp. H1M3-3]|uniref:TonB-dependent receptor domain-containing protein n=1 Tax=Chryseolinea sp. H1M3-3 TaxID=3034144 RepID=UPI0023EC4196|nr:TonB-dependent receptor [Chryseolinea sp. H1M3-3]